MKQRIIVLFLGMILSSHGIEQSTQTIINQAEQASKFGAIDAKALIHSLKDPVGNIPNILKGKTGKGCTSAPLEESPGKCGINLKFQEPDNLLAQLYIFVSASMLQESIKVLGQQAKKIGAQVVFRGLVGGTFPRTQKYMKELGVAANIDPPKFDDHKITVVPTYILVNKNVSDRVAGHISLFEALDQFRKKGELKTEAQRLYQNLHGKRSES